MADAVIQRRRCRTCKGVYLAVLPDGFTYYHQCPRLSESEVAALPPKPGPAPEPGDKRRNHRNENLRSTDGPGAREIQDEGDGVDEM